MRTKRVLSSDDVQKRVFNCDDGVLKKRMTRLRMVDDDQVTSVLTMVVLITPPLTRTSSGDFIGYSVSDLGHTDACDTASLLTDHSLD